VKLGNDPEIEKFRADLNAFLDEYAPPARRHGAAHLQRAHPEWTRRWQRSMFDHGWLLPGQPPRYGGRNASPAQVLAHTEELARRRIYHSFNPQGVGSSRPRSCPSGPRSRRGSGRCRSAGRDDRRGRHEASREPAPTSPG